MSVTRRAIQSLTPRDKTSFVVTVAIRMATNILDIVGLLLVGVTVTLLTAPNAENPTFVSIQDAFAFFNFEINYVFVAALAVVFFLLKSGLAMYLNKLIAKFVARIETERAARAYTNFLKSNLDELARWDDKDILHGVSASANMAFGQSLLITSIIFGESALLLGVSAYLLFVHWQLFLLMLLYFTVFGTSMSLFVGRRTAKSSARMQENSLNSQRTVLDSIANFRQIRSSGKQQQFVSLFSQTRLAQAQANGEMVNLGYLPRYVTEIALIFGVALFILFKTVFGQVGIPFDVIAIFVAGAFRIIASLLPLSASVGTLRRVEIEGKFADELLHLSAAQKVAPGDDIDFDPSAPAIEFIEASYTYPNAFEATLSNVTFKVATGEFVAIVGRSGAGKSTIADLILGLRNPTRGQILLMGDKSENLVEGNSSVIGYVPQNTLLVAGTVADNVTLNITDHHLDAEKLRNALKKVNLLDAVEALPQGILTEIGIAGSTLSGGQIQRIGLARALYSDPQILVLDEITSALDSETEEAVRACIEELAKSKTLIVIAHKLATLRKASRVLVVENGTVRVESSGAFGLLDLLESEGEGSNVGQ